MGVPKFFRYISERYPCLSELVKDYQIPEFDHLYLDMNGIIHNCSHPNDDDPHFRITEENIFKDIFHYIEVLFRMIKPQKLFFMAVDGVAPRAKMNQQRGRRFRSAADAAKAEAEAIKKGEKLPTEARFDSNCITPGTVFMAKLHEQLKYFVVDKISNDPLWQNCKVILSGHETPGEGEHKIMDYIRYMRTQPNYDPNTRHCLYGLDADLIMLGLCTHEPHFSLLREEVKFGKKSTKRITVPEEITFFLLHLSLLRDYLELEFTPIKYKLRNFDFDLEKIIDDWVLMGFLVGNDFIPHLPNLHIAEGALPILYSTYMEVLPTLDGYINEGGTLNLKRFEAFLQKLGEQDLVNFEQVRDDILYLESKRGNRNGNLTRNLEEWTPEENDDGIVFETLETETTKTKDSGLEALLKSADDLCLDDDTEDGTESDEDDDEFANFKKDYYKQKLEYKDVTPEVLRDQAEGFVRAIQWNLNYYYNGCSSWSWFYPHHYAPYISDIKGFTNLNIEFDMGKPFYPYEQLLAVLPAASKQLLPECYHGLMTNENSIIIDYYPENFECDLNGKKQAWEAVVKIPFIDEKLLLEAMSYCNDKLTSEEKRRNSHGPMLIYMYTHTNNGPYPSPCYFPEVLKNYTVVKNLLYSDILIPREKLIKGAYPGVHIDMYYPGFPVMKHLQYRGELQAAHVKVFDHPSRNESMIVKIIPDSNFAGDMIPVDLLGTSVFVGWPHLIEAKVLAISNRNRKFISMGGPNQYNAVELKERDVNEFNLSINGITEYYKNRMGIDFGETKVLVYVSQLIGRKFNFNTSGKLIMEKQFAENTSCFPLQAIVFNIAAYDPQKNVVKDVENIFPKNSICFTLTNPYYGSQGVIQDSAQVSKTGRIKISVSVLEEPNLLPIRDMFENVYKKYKPAYHFASPLCISNVYFSKLTGAVHISTGNESRRANIGLDLKLNKMNKETPGYTKKVNNTWLYTQKAADLVNEYIEKFPEVLDCLNMEEELTVEKVFLNDSEEKFSELKQWLKSLPTQSIEKSPCNSIGLEPDAILELEKIVETFKSGNVKKVTMQVKPNFLYRPEVQNGTLEPDPKTKTEILDRIVNTRHGYTVPFGFKGTVTAIRNADSKLERDTIYEVIFDKSFRDGLKLNCSDNRGYMLPKTAFVNISYGHRLMIEKTGKPDELMAKAAAFNSNNYNNQNQYFSNLVRPQPSFQQQRIPQQNVPLFVPQTHSTLNQSNSAFAYFTSNTHREALDVASMSNEKKSVQQFFNNNHVSAKQEVTNQRQNPESKKVDKDAVQQFFNKHKQDTNRSQPNENKNSSNVKDSAKYNSTKSVKEIRTNRDSLIAQESRKSSGKSYEKLSSDMKQSAEIWRQPYDSYSKHNFDLNRQPTDNYSNKHKSVNCFMPNFGANSKTATKEATTEYLHDSDQSATNSNAKAATVNTDFLKNILGIGKNHEKDQNVKHKIDENRKDWTTKPLSKVKDEAKSSNVSFDMLAQVANTSASVRLLTYYQSNQLGLPRYQYFPVENQMVRAQITLNDGQVITGKPSKSQEEASENVATIVLDALLKKGTSLNQIVQKPNIIPSPPVNWVQAENKNKEKQFDKTVISRALKDKPRSNHSELTATAVLNNSFVPLQAIKRHISKSGGTNSNAIQRENVHENNVTSIKKHSERRVDSEQPRQEKKNLPVNQKPKRERKTRIAANFLKKN